MVSIETAVFLDVMRGLVHGSCQFSLADARYHFSPAQPNSKYCTVPAFARREWGTLKVPCVMLGQNWNLGLLEHKVPPCC